MSNPLISDVYVKIASRLASFTPGIRIGEHIDTNLQVGRTTLDGISFKAKNPGLLRTALRNAKDVNGEPAFAEGSRAIPSIGR